MLAAANELPIVYDEDSPELTDEMEKAFIAARKEKTLSWGTAYPLCFHCNDGKSKVSGRGLHYNSWQIA